MNFISLRKRYLTTVLPLLIGLLPVKSADAVLDDLLEIVVPVITVTAKNSPKCQPGCPICWEGTESGLSSNTNFCLQPFDRSHILRNARASITVGAKGYSFSYAGPYEVNRKVGCSFFPQSSSALTTLASFQLVEPPAPQRLNDYFSFTDLGDGYSNWGLYDHSSNEEWSGSGENQTSIFGKINPVSDAYGGGFELTVRWAGEATENFSAVKKSALVSFTCFFDWTEKPNG